MAAITDIAALPGIFLKVKPKLTKIQIKDIVRIIINVGTEPMSTYVKSAPPITAPKASQKYTQPKGGSLFILSPATAQAKLN